ncbi:unnamed protein product [Cyprideis torosa]|uniref:dCTP pyrophosphatase 1 n=1 Tax=Cyprideis torosa TaxID=163714 RepID=A0A7R8WUA7_9CRUS|nr:unnamed protein product [Cyprideis torosa]CAG0910413.1 unnamed protein product [Cyprideis torosa]
MIDEQAILTAFYAVALEKGWEPFHSPRNLAAAISVEAAELLELHQWELVPEPMDVQTRTHAANEVADLLMYLVVYCDKAGIDIEEAIREKCAMNRQRFLKEPSNGREE